MKASFIGFFLLVLAVSQNCEAVSVSHTLEVKVGIFDAAKCTLYYSFDDTQYNAESKVETTGIFGGIYPFVGKYTSGGKINGEYQFTYGADTRSQIENYHADKVFLSVDGITASDGFSSYYEEDVDILRVMIENSAQTYVLADYTKIGRNAFVKVDGADRIDCLVTNEKPDPELEKLKKLGVRIEFA